MDFVSKADAGPAGSLSWPFISVVLPVRNEAATIEPLLASLLAQEYPPERFEIIVCDGYSTDETYELVEKIAARDGRVILLRNEGRRSSSGRNTGYRRAIGDIVLFVDGHCIIPERHLLHSAAELFGTTGADCLCRPQPLAPDEQGNIWSAAIAAVRASRFGHSRSSFIFSETEGYVSPVSAGAAYKREVFETIGEYDESFDACEDVEFNVRVEKAGFKSYISPRMKVLYHARRGLAGLFTQMNRYGWGRFKLLRKHPDTLEWQTLVPPLFVLLTFFALLVFVFVPPLRGAVVFAAILCYVAMLAATYRAGGPFGRRGWPLYPVVLFVIYGGLGWGFIRGALVNMFSRSAPNGPGRGRRHRET